MSTEAPPPLVAAPADWTADVLVDEPPRPVARQRGRWFGWSATSLPVAPLLLTGLLLGPQGLLVLGPNALGALDPALPVALATLGALLGLMPGFSRPVQQSAAGATWFAAITGLIVCAGFVVGGLLTSDVGAAQTWGLALVLGIAASSSLMVPSRSQLGATRLPLITPEGETVVAVVVGGVLLAVARHGTFVGAVFWLVQACAIVSVLGLAGWVLLRHGGSQSERRVFAVATALLVGGAADALSFSALLGGMCAGALWNLGGGTSRDSLKADMLYAVHPLVALVLIVAGARAEVSTVALGLAAGYACLRTVGRFASVTVARRLRASAALDMPRPLAPGIFGVAFALNAFRSVGSDLSLAVSVVVLGTILAELASVVIWGDERA